MAYLYGDYHNDVGIKFAATISANIFPRYYIVKLELHINHIGDFQSYNLIIRLTYKPTAFYIFLYYIKSLQYLFKK